MKARLWIGPCLILMIGFVYVVSQPGMYPPTQGFQNAYEQQRRLWEWRQQHYITRFPYKILPVTSHSGYMTDRQRYTAILSRETGGEVHERKVFLVVVYLVTKPSTCPSLPAADSLGVSCCGNHLTSAECQAPAHNNHCTFSISLNKCIYDCINFTSNQAQCEGVGCTYVNLGPTIILCTA